MKEIIDGHRRTAVKTRHKQMVEQKKKHFEDNDHSVIVVENGGYYYLYTKKNSDLEESRPKIKRRQK